MDILPRQLLELKNVPKDIFDEQLDALTVITEGRYDPVAFVENILGLTLYEEQKVWLWATTYTQQQKCYDLMMKKGIYFTTPENLISEIELLYTTNKHILAVANQIGKTFLASLKHIWSLFYKVGIRVNAEHLDMAEYKTLNISPHSDQSHKCFEYVQRILRGELVYYDPISNSTKVNKLHPVIEGFQTGQNENLGELKFGNGAIFYSKSSAQDKATSRAGEQFGLITFDECAQSRHLMSEITMLQSRLIRYGYSFDLVSSPEVEKPSHQAYYRLVKKGSALKDGWFALTNIGLLKNVYIHPEQKQKAIDDITSTDKIKAIQMLEGRFVSAGKRFIPMEAVNQLFNHNGRVRKLEMGLPGRKYLLVADWGMSDTGDPSWFFVLDWTDFVTENRVDIVHHEIIKGGSPTMQLTALRVIYQNFGGNGEKDGEGNTIWEPCIFVTDTNSMGGVMIKKMLWDLKPVSFDSHGSQKDQMLAELHNALNWKRDFEYDDDGNVIERNPDFGKIRSYYIEELEEQLGSYNIIDDKKLETDAVMSLGMGIWYLEKKIPKKPQQRMALNPLSRYNQIRSNSSL